MDYQKIRSHSLELARGFNLNIPETLPLIDDASLSKNTDATAERAIVLSTVVASSYGFNKDASLDWLSKESLLKKLSPD